MNNVLAIFFITIIIYSVIFKQFRILFIISLLSLFGDMFYVDFFGSRIVMHHFISLLITPLLLLSNIQFKNSDLYGVNLEYFLLICLGLAYGVLFPWNDGEWYRSWSQMPFGRSCVALIRIFSEIMLMYFTYFVVANKIINLKDFVNILSGLIIIIFCVALADTIFGYPIYKVLFNVDELSPNLINRFLGFSKEPRSFGRLLAFAWLVLLLFKLNNFKFSIINQLAFFVGLMSILLAFSFSTYFAVVLCTLYLLKPSFSKLKLELKITNMSILVVIFLITIPIIMMNNNYERLILPKYKLVTEGKAQYQMVGEPFVFTKFEVFDRAALNFFYNNPRYLFLGTGPNLIGIPSSEYLDRSAYITCGGHIVSFPGMGVINIISRSGLLGLALYIATLLKIYVKLKKNNLVFLSELLIFSSIFYFIVTVPWFYASIGLILGYIHKFQSKNEILLRQLNMLRRSFPRRRESRKALDAGSSPA